MMTFQGKADEEREKYLMRQRVKRDLVSLAVTEVVVLLSLGAFLVLSGCAPANDERAPVEFVSLTLQINRSQQ